MPFSASRFSVSRFSTATRGASALMCLALPALLPAPAHAQYSFSAITLDPGLVSVYGFNDRLQVYGTDAGGNVVITNPNHAGLNNLGTLDPTVNQNTPFAVNKSGQVAGFGALSANNVTHAFLSGPNGLMDLGAFSNSLDPTQDLSSYAYGLNNKGQVVGYGDDLYNAGNGVILGVSHAFLYSNGVLTDLSGIPNSGDPSGASANSEALGINDAGVIVGDGDTQVAGGAFEDHAFVYRNGMYSTLGTLNNTVSSVATGINNANQIIGNSTYKPGDVSDQHAFLHTGTGPLTAADDLGTFGGASSSAFFVSDSGVVFGMADDASGASLPFVYQNGVKRRVSDFVPASFGLSNLLFYGLNNNNQILGSGTNAQGSDSFFLLTPNAAPAAVPEPGALALLAGAGLSTAGLLIRRRRRNRVAA